MEDGKRGRIVLRGRFRSRSVHTLDAKGRLNIPSRFREALREYDCETLMLVPLGDHIRAYPLEIWAEMEERLVDQGMMSGELESIVYMVGGAEECPLDKQGRILLKPGLREEGFIPGKDVMLTGMVKWFEIQDREFCEATLKKVKGTVKQGISALSKKGLI